MGDFSRLGVSEGLVPVLKDVDVGRILFEAKTQSSSIEKQIERLERSPLVQSTKFKNVKLDQIGNKDFFSALIQKY